jgi:hypothetical protein
MMITKKPSILLFAAVLAAGLMGGVSTAIASAPETTTEHAASPVASPAEASKGSASAASDSARYAEREKTAGKQEAFRGGAVAIYIGGSVLAVALLIILAILIL